MTVDRLPGRVREFANYLNGLLARLDQGGGWCGVFWQRDPEGMRACLDGREVPPWDVLEALLQDLAAHHGPAEAVSERERARAAHAAALAAYDARPGGREALADRLAAMLRRQRYAAEHQALLSRRLTDAATQDELDALRTDLAWAHDDHTRATARCAELRARLTMLPRHTTPATGTRAPDPGAPGFVTDASGPAVDASGLVPGASGRTPGATASGAGAVGGVPGVVAPVADGTNPAADVSGRVRGAMDAGADAMGRVAGAVAPDPDVVGFVADASGRVPGAVARGAGAKGRAPGAVAPGAGASGPAPGAIAPAQDPAGRTARADGTGQPASAGTGAARAETAGGVGRKRRRGSARFAGMAEEEAVAEGVPPEAGLVPAPAPAAAARRGPRGARFAGAAGPEAAEAARPRTEPVDAGAGQAVAGAVAALARLRGEGRTGEAHAVLIEAAHWPAARLPLLAAELERAGLGADWATLLWEAASLPADRVVAAADALVAAGRAGDGRQIVRQGVARPAAEIGEAVLGLVGGGRRREARALLDAYVRVRAPEEAARSVEGDPQRLVPLLLEAARGVSDERHWDLVHALRVAGFAT
ncbi:hypothetical protein [Streptomyces sp. NPDC096152]|uniref:hypothetical protein n=1 Tax=Streptomyces sp. NPDC096152 TaxID=3366078 RepID=UPI0037FC0984